MGATTIWMLACILGAAAGTWIARQYALRRQLLDQPGDRRSHSVATPRGGGIAIVACMLVGVVGAMIQDPGQSLLWTCLGAGLALVAGIGWLDDHRPLSPLLRLAVQAIAASLLAWGFHQAGGTLWTSLMAFMAAMVLVNVWNFMDGIDGLAASQAGIAAAGLALATGGGTWSWLAWGLVAAIAGFLPFNFPRARIFLGDVGSGSLGYLLAALLVGSAQSASGWPGALILLLPLAAFLIDAGFTLSGRILRGERWWEPHVQHSYQVWARRAGRHWPVTLAYALFSLLAVILMLAALRWPEGAIIGSVLLCYVFAVLAWARLRRDVSLSKDAGR
ncbi:MAG: hypothetical protein EOP92_26185 [Lysobacteraceae bacterium]|nr:MAG: hypothetical protein EOP92_26185 [Xanthomonadaceae bacterium]